MGTDGGTLTITGSNFGDDTKYLSVMIGNKEAYNYEYIEPHSSFTCSAEEGVDEDIPVVVSIGDVDSGIGVQHSEVKDINSWQLHKSHASYNS